MFIDIHTHLPQYDEDELDGIIQRWESKIIWHIRNVTSKYVHGNSPF